MYGTVYLVVFVWITFAYGTIYNGQNKIEHGQDDDGTHDVNEKVVAEGPEAQERAPYFINLRKMSGRHVKPQGNMINLKCKAGGHPTPNVTWYKNNEVPTRHLGNIRYGSWSLTLEDLVTDDSGDYRCVVCNALGCVSYNYTVVVVERYHHRPIITDPPQNKTVAVGSNVNFSCTCVSDLNPYIYWVKGIPSENGTVKTMSASQNPEILELVKVTPESEGWYTCVAANSLGMTASSAYLRVVDTIETGSQPQSLLLVSLAGIVTVIAICAVIVVVAAHRRYDLLYMYSMQ